MTIATLALPEESVLIGATLFLMTKYAERPCPDVRRAIVTHLHWLAHHPSPLLSADQRRMYGALALQWRGPADAEGQPQPAALLAPAAAGYLQ